MTCEIPGWFLSAGRSAPLVLLSVVATGIKAIWIQLDFGWSSFDRVKHIRATGRWHSCILVRSTCNSLIWELAAALLSQARQILLIPAVPTEVETWVMCTDCISHGHNRSNHTGNSADLCLCLMLNLVCTGGSSGFGAEPSSRNGMKWW